MAESPAQDWFLQDWMRHFGKRQSSLVNERGWTKGRAFYIWHGKVAYSRDVVNEIANWLGIQPHELLMAPKEAMALRQLRESAALIVAEQSPGFEPSAPNEPPPRRSARGR